MQTIAAGHVLRAPTAADARAVAELLRARDLVDLGRAEVTVGDVRRARARGARVVRQFVPTADTAARSLLLDAGWWPVHHYFRMQMALRDAPPPPPVLVRAFDERHDVERARGRGHGRTLLLLLLAAFRRSRLRFAEAAVHGRTGAAARLFESVGMVAVRRTERWEKVLGV